MSKLTDVIISAIVKKGILYEARNCDLDFDIPQEELADRPKKDKIHVHVKMEHMSIRVEKGESLNE